MLTLDIPRTPRENAIVAFLDDKTYSIEEEFREAQQIAEHVTLFDHPKECIEWANDTMRHPEQFSPTGKLPNLVLVVDMDVPTLKDLRAFGSNKIDPREGFTGGVTFIENCRRAKGFLFF